MMKTAFSTLFIMSLIMISCAGPLDEKPQAQNGDSAITAFGFSSPAAEGTVNEATHTIAVTVPYGTNVTALTPAISHTGSSVSPASGIAQDFTAPVTYMVTAADLSTQAYVVTIYRQFEDSFDRADSSSVGNGWIKTEQGGGATVSLYENRLRLTSGSAGEHASVQQSLSLPDDFTATITIRFNSSEKRVRFDAYSSDSLLKGYYFMIQGSTLFIYKDITTMLASGTGISGLRTDRDYSIVIQKAASSLSFTMIDTVSSAEGSVAVSDPTPYHDFYTVALINNLLASTTVDICDFTVRTH